LRPGDRSDAVTLASRTMTRPATCAELSRIASGEVRLLGARIDGSIDLTGAHLGDVKGVALGVDDAVIGGSIYLVGQQGGRDLWADGT
jgi:hypothetical protein